MRKILKSLLLIIITLAIAGGIFYYMQNEAEPQSHSENTEEAIAMANKMLEAVNYQAWENTNIVKWDFKAMHSFVWDKQHNFVQVKWKNKDVRLDLSNLENYVVYTDEVKLKDTTEAQKIKQEAWEYFCNDSFWLNAPAKVFDEGTSLSVVDYEGEKALKVKYHSGGVTPGDAYLWFLDKNGLPYKIKMWVSIIPVGGVEATWSEWKKIKTGAMIATEHELIIIKILIKNLNAGDKLEDVGVAPEIFDELTK